MTKKKSIMGCLAGVMLLAGCYSNNCPMENTVLCNYGFYDSEGTAITYKDVITVSTLLPGWHNVYIYRKMGFQTVTLDHVDESLINNGYTMSVSEERVDTVLVNKATNVTKLSVPMSYFHDADTLVFSYASIASKDTIWIDHSSYPHVELPECGTYRFHTLKNVRSTHYAIDRVEIGASHVNYEGKENVKIFFNGLVEM